ncbi:proline and serine-rich protein 3 [Phyllobates terribilis]|uniref:proline and serine-rich protein 3 n=1 Tax=Phyllobates terribilis TaxID=111132 RepID=UPI003CCAFC37
MKSSVAVFSNQGDPFPTQTRARTHYRPSIPQTLNEAQRKTVLSPDRLHSLPHHLSDALSPPDLSFLVGSQRLLPGLPESDSSEPFDESWPSTEGSSKTPERDEGPTATNSGGTEKQKVPGSEESVLARYIARFRSGCPTSRGDRSPPHFGVKDFWWLQDSSYSPEMQRFRPDSGTSAPRGSSPYILERTPPLEESSVNDSRLCPDEVDIAGLQLRAGKLILRSESSLSSVGPVSSEGLGSSPVSNVSSSGSDGRTRPPPLDTTVLAPIIPVSRPILTPIRAHSTPAPEEDILYQWRLRRKMEQAREGTMQVTTRKRSPSPPVRIPRQGTHTEDSTDLHYQISSQGAVQSAYGPSQPHDPTSYLSHVPLASPSVTPNGNVPPHLHLLCDILPCVQSQKVPGTWQRKAEGVHPAAQHREDVTQQPQQRQRTPERQRTSAQTEEKKRKPKGDRRIRDKTQPGQKGPSRTRVGRVPESPIHQALEQVISERLFSPLPSPKPKSEKREQRPSAPFEEDDADPRPVEIAAHLLEEAEGSDGADFDDDPLLQVLRDQRASLLAKLRAVDSRLAELEEREPPPPSHHPDRSRV